MFRSVGGVTAPRWGGVDGHRSLNSAANAEDFFWVVLRRQMYTACGYYKQFKYIWKPCNINHQLNKKMQCIFVGSSGL